MSNRYYYTCKTCGANLDPGEECDICKANGITPVNTFIYPKSYDKTKHVKTCVADPSEVETTSEESYRHKIMTVHRLPKCGRDKIKR